MNKVLVTDAGLRNVIAAIRSLGKKGLAVVAAEDNRFAMGFFSKHTHATLIYPSPKKQPNLWLDWLTSRISAEKFDVIMPMDDETVAIVSENKELIEKYAKTTVPDFNTLMRAKDKAQTIDFAKKVGISCPLTIVANSLSEADDAAEITGFPLVIKPRESSGSRGIVYVREKAQFQDAFLKVQQKYPSPMIQEYIPKGGQSIGVFLLFNKTAEPRAVFAHKRLREFPLSGGPSTLRESVHAPALVEQSINLLKAINWFGVAMVEFKQDPRDNKFKIMEINPRFWGSLQLSILAGVDFPYLLYKMVIDGDVIPVMTYPSGVRCRWLLPGDILNFIYNPNRFREKPSFFNFSKNNRADDFLSLSDIGPTLAFLLCILRDIFKIEKWRHVLRK